MNEVNGTVKYFKIEQGLTSYGKIVVLEGERVHEGIKFTNEESIYEFFMSILFVISCLRFGIKPQLPMSF